MKQLEATLSQQCKLNCETRTESVHKLRKIENIILFPLTLPSNLLKVNKYIQQRLSFGTFS